MSKDKNGITTLLDQTCLWRTGKKVVKNGKKNWPRLRVIDGTYVLLTEKAPVSA